MAPETTKAEGVMGARMAAVGLRSVKTYVLERRKKVKGKKNDEEKNTGLKIDIPGVIKIEASTELGAAIAEMLKGWLSRKSL